MDRQKGGQTEVGVQGNLLVKLNQKVEIRISREKQQFGLQQILEFKRLHLRGPFLSNSCGSTSQNPIL
jgi:hypothetical protein